MALTTETVRALLLEYFGRDFSATEVERLRPLLDRQQERMRQLHALDLGGADPRTMRYITDRRLLK